MTLKERQTRDLDRIISSSFFLSLDCLSRFVMTVHSGNNRVINRLLCDNLIDYNIPRNLTAPHCVQEFCVPPSPSYASLPSKQLFCFFVFCFPIWYQGRDARDLVWCSRPASPQSMCVRVCVWCARVHVCVFRCKRKVVFSVCLCFGKNSAPCSRGRQPNVSL